MQVSALILGTALLGKARSYGADLEDVAAGYPHDLLAGYRVRMG